MTRITFTLLLAATAHAQQPLTREKALDLAGNVHVIFERKCNECHGRHLAKPDGRFGYVLDLKRMADNFDYIQRGKAHQSELFRLVNEGEMPPDDHPKTPPLTGEEKDIVRRWIQAGAPHELPATLPKRVFVEPPSSAAAAVANARQKRVSLDLRDQSAAMVFAEITRQARLDIHYTAPRNEPHLSITLQRGTAAEALDYLALCGNLVLTWSGDTAWLRPHDAQPAAQTK